jgi:hypothetical protein
MRARRPASSDRGRDPRESTGSTTFKVIGRIIPGLSSSWDAHVVERIALKREAGSRH